MLKHFQKKKRPGHAASLPQKANCRLTYQLETTGSTGGRKASIQWASWPSVSHTDTGWLSGDRPRARLPCLVVLNQTGRLKLSRYVCTGLSGMCGYWEVTSQWPKMNTYHRTREDGTYSLSGTISLSPDCTVNNHAVVYSLYSVLCGGVSWMTRYSEHRKVIYTNVEMCKKKKRDL